jgi:hypothetical protein
MSTIIKRSHEQLTTERARGWILKLLDEARPDPVELAVLTLGLDALNLPLTRRGLGRELDYLRSQKLVRVFPLGSNDELDNVAQARWVQRYSNTDTDAECGGSLCALITANGINFQAGLTVVDGIFRVE